MRRRSGGPNRICARLDIVANVSLGPSARTIILGNVPGELRGELSFALGPYGLMDRGCWQVGDDTEQPVVGQAGVRTINLRVRAADDPVVALVGAPEGGDVERLVGELATAVSGDGGGGRRPWSAGVSRVARTPADLATAHEQARKAVQIGRLVHGGGGVAHFDKLGVFRVLSLVPDAAELRSFVTEVLGELAIRDDAETADLRHTLEVLLETNLNVAETARRLHFHYNTLRYRIAKLERLLGPFTEDPHLRLDVLLALQVLKMRGI